MKKKLLALAVSVLLLFTQSIAAYGSPAYEGYDSAKEIIVRTAQELAAISGDGYYVIREDIDLEGFDWQGISNFSGTLIGLGHTIKNLKSDKCGLFERVGSGARIKDLILEDVEIGTKTKMLGGIVSYVPSSAKDVTIENCSVSGVLNTLYDNSESKRNFCGAIAGVVASKDCSIKYCSSSATVEAICGEGGIVGLNYGKIYGSFFTGRVRCAGNNNYFLEPDEDGGYPLVYYFSHISGGIAAVNYGEISECAVILNDFDMAVYFGLICGINIKGKGSIKDCFTPSALDLSKYDIEHYSPTANVLTPKEYSNKFKKR